MLYLDEYHNQSSTGTTRIFTLSDKTNDDTETTSSTIGVGGTDTVDLYMEQGTVGL